MERKRKYKRLIVILLFVLMFVLMIQGILVIFNSLNKPLQVFEYVVKYEVANKGIGFDVNGTALAFGRTSPGGPSIVRRFNVTNMYEFPIEVKVLFSENVADVINANYSYIVMEGETASLPFELIVPADYPVGKYIGKVRLELYRFKE